MRKRAYSSGLVVAIRFFAARTGFMLVFGLYAQVGLGYSPLQTGLTMAPWAFGTAAAAAFSGGMAQRLGRRLIHAGLAVMTVGMAAFHATLQLVGHTVQGWQMAPAGLLCGLGMGLVLAPLLTSCWAVLRTTKWAPALDC